VSHKYGRIGMILAAILVLAVAPAGVAAADPSGDPVVNATAIAFDATLTVHYTDAVTLLAVGGAAVHVTARQGDAVLGAYDATADAAGVAVIPGLPRETGVGDAVQLDVVADKDTTSTDAESGCTISESWHAERTALAVDSAAVELSFADDEQQATSSITCPGPDPSGEVDAATGRPHITPPATDTHAAGTNPTSGGTFLVVGLLVALAGLALVAPMRRAGRR
jgi:hypothetical protein